MADVVKTNTTTAAPLYPTRIDLSEGTRQQVIDLLNQALADISDLYSQTKQAHWNVKGEHFYSLHKLFDELAAGIEEYMDTIAERVTALGGTALGTVRMAAQNSILPEYPVGRMNGMQHVQCLVDRYGMFGAQTRAGIDISAEAGDADTADLLTEISRDVDKFLWFLEAHLQVGGDE